jgi:dGTPase
VRRLFEHYVEHPEQLPAPPEKPGGAREGGAGGEEDALARRVTDYLAGMTDRYCIRRYTELEVPQAFAR